MIIPIKDLSRKCGSSKSISSTRLFSISCIYIYMLLRLASVTLRRYSNNKIGHFYRGNSNIVNICISFHKKQILNLTNIAINH